MTTSPSGFSRGRKTIRQRMQLGAMGRMSGKQSGKVKTGMFFGKPHRTSNKTQFRAAVGQRHAKASKTLNLNLDRGFQPRGEAQKVNRNIPREPIDMESNSVFRRAVGRSSEHTKFGYPRRAVLKSFTASGFIVDERAKPKGRK